MYVYIDEDLYMPAFDTPYSQITDPNCQQDEKFPAFDPEVASHAIADGINYLCSRLDWSGTKVANILHLRPNTVNGWIKAGAVPIKSLPLQPDFQAVIHLLAIHRSLEAMFDNPEHQRLWLSTFNPDLDNKPEKIMSSSIDGLIYVRQYLDYIQGRGA